MPEKRVDDEQAAGRAAPGGGPASGYPNRGRLRVYALLSRVPFLGGYRIKLLLAAFLGLHVPLLALTLYVVLGSPAGLGTTLSSLLVVLLATLVGTAATLWVLSALLAPVSLSSRALREYVERGTKPDLPTRFTDRAGSLMADLQRTVDRAERMDRAVRSLEELVTRDHLTGAYNRRAGEERLKEDVARVARGGGALTLAVLDVDRFKQVNDRYGHPAGDACLRHVVEVVERNVRTGDWLARWGGDEFVLALWGAESGHPSAEATLERIGEDLRRDAVRLPQGAEVRLTLSAGACRYAGAGETAQELLSRADRALYRAKRDGQGKIFYHDGA